MRKNTYSEKTENWTSFLLFLLAVVIVLGLVIKTLIVETEPKEINENTLPRIDLILEHEKLENIRKGDKEKKYPVKNVSITMNDKTIDYGSAELKGRGNSTWGNDKSPYQIKFEEKTELLGMGKRKKWILLANYFDESSGLRNDIAFKLAEIIGEEYATRGEFVDFYVNGTYEGLYYLVRRIEIEKNSVNLKGERSVLAEHDIIHGMWNENCLTDYGSMFIFKDSPLEYNKRIYNEIKNDFISKINTIEKAVEDDDYDIVEKNADLDSLAEYYLINEFAVNPDAYSSSFYFYTEGNGDKIHFGPVWDFDLAFGSKKWYWTEDENYYSPEHTMARYEETISTKTISSFVFRLMKFPEFRSRVAKVFRERMSGRMDELLTYYDEKVEYIRESANNDRARYQDAYLEDFDTETMALRDYIARRFNYFENVYGEYGSFGEFENYEYYLNKQNNP